jgi:hypothetical protein
MHNYFKIQDYIASQVPAAIENLSKIIQDFDLILEIGTERGTLSYWIQTNKKTETEFRTYEIDLNMIMLNENDKALINIRHIDCFSPECVEEIKTLIQTKGRTLLLCDGGHKNEEFNLYAQYLKPQDVIMLHDYTDNEEDFKSFQEKHGWPHYPESSYPAIEHTVKEQNLEKFMYPEFKSSFWGSFIKK